MTSKGSSQQKTQLKQPIFVVLSYVDGDRFVIRCKFKHGRMIFECMDLDDGEMIQYGSVIYDSNLMLPTVRGGLGIDIGNI